MTNSQNSQKVRRFGKGQGGKVSNDDSVHLSFKPLHERSQLKGDLPRKYWVGMALHRVLPTPRMSPHLVRKL